MHGAPPSGKDAPRRILFVGQMAYALFDPSCPTPFGGAELQLYLLANEMANDPSNEVHFLVHDFGQPRKQRFGGITVWRSKRLLKGVRGFAAPRFAWNMVTLFSTMLRVHADVIVQSPAGLPTPIAALVARLQHSLFMFRVASDADIGQSLLVYPGEAAAYRWGLRHAGVVIVRSDRQRADLLRRYAKGSIVIPSAFPVPSVAPGVPKAHVLWVASSQMLKQPWLFLDLAREFPGERFLMIMPMNDPALFRRIADEAGTLPNLEFCDGVPFAEIQDYFDRAKVFINTSTIEGFPNTFVQSAMGATPVLSLNVDPDDVLTRRGFGRCAHGDADLLFHDLGELLSDEDLRQRMGAAAFEYASEVHGMRSVTSALLDVIEDARGA